MTERILSLQSAYIRSVAMIGGCLFIAAILVPSSAGGQTVESLPTEVFVGVCGDGMVHPGQECDDGEENNIGAYSATIEGRTCGPDCKWAPYCGDSIVQSEFGEECDDGTNTDEGFCTADCKALPPVSPPPGGSGGGGGAFQPGSDQPVADTVVTLQGRAYPNSNVNILKDGTTIGVVSSNSQAAFSFTTSGIEPGVTTFGLWAEDNLGLRSVSHTVTFEVSEGASTVVSGVFIPPTIDIESTTVAPGSSFQIFGQSVPEVEVATEVHSEAKLTQEVEADEDGNWSMTIDSSSLEIGQHSARAFFRIEQDGAVLESSFSRAIAFFVGDGTPTDGLTADLNGDGRVGIADFSILLFHWGTGNPIADINGDGSVGLADFSIMLFQWTG